MAVLEKIFEIHSKEMLTYRVRKVYDADTFDLDEVVVIEVKEVGDDDVAFSNMKIEITPDALPLIIEALSSFVKT